MRKSIFIVFLGAFYFTLQIAAQKKMQVITRITEETYAYENDFLLDIEAEKANIIITKGVANKVTVKLKQVVKNPNISIAEQHMKAHKFVFNREKDRLYLHNFIMFNEEADKMTSLFSSSYEISLPEACYIKIKNTLGNISIADLKGSLFVNIEYGKLDLNNFSGKFTSSMHIGDLNIKNSFVDADLQNNNVITRITSCGGTFQIKSSFGSVSQTLTRTLTNLSISSDNTEITLINKENYLFNFYIKNKNGSINLLSNEKISKEGEFNVFTKNESSSIGDIRIEAEYGEVSIY